MSFFDSVFLIASAVCFIAGVVNFFWLSKEKRITRRLLEITAAVVAAVVLLMISTAAREGQKLFPSTLLIETMQVFSLDAAYSIEADYLQSPILRSIVTVYKTILFTVAPIVGGAVIYDVLSGISPDIGMELAKRKRLYIFSEINEKSVSLAESIYKETAKNGRSAIVFTDSYFDNSEEAESELFLRANDIHAICLRDDILHCRCFRKAEACYFFLMDEDDEGKPSDTENLITLKNLLTANKERWNTKKDCQIFIFSDDNETVHSICTIRKSYEKQMCGGNAERIRVHAVRDLAQSSCMLMKNEPLFKAVMTEGEQKLRVLIIGNNAFSREMFKTVFWCGQLLDCTLYITVAYSPGDQTKDELLQWLGRNCPEIVRSCIREDDCLLIRENEYSEPYAALCFIETDVKSVNMSAFLEEERSYYKRDGETFRLKDHDYFIVMNESDNDNLKTAFELQRALSCLSEGQRGGKAQIVSACIENEALADVLNMRYREIREANEKKGTEDPVEMFVFGSLRERFSWKNITADGVYLAEINKEHKDLLIEKHGMKERSESYDDIYNEWAKAARAFHMPYKMFSVGIDLSSAENAAEAKLAYCEKLAEPAVIEELSWLEHRRWTAFTRTQGYSCPRGTIAVSKAALNGTLAVSDHSELQPYCVKDIFLHLHPCLVECERTVSGEPDFLDVNNWIRTTVKTKAPLHVENKYAYMKGRETGHKKYDRPDGKNAPTLSEEELCRVLANGGSIKRSEIRETFPWIEKCAHTEYRDAYWADLVAEFKSIEEKKVNDRKHRTAEKRAGECTAFALGENSEAENGLIKRGKLKRLADGSYEVFSREAVNGKGESAEIGDYIKLDLGGYPYPVQKEKFSAMHELRDGKWFQKSRTSELWLLGDPVNDVMEYLIAKRKLCLKTNDKEHYFNANRHGTMLSAKEEDAVVFYSVKRDDRGLVTDVDFDFVARDELEKSYTI